MYIFPSDLCLILDFQVPMGLKKCLNNANDYNDLKERIAFDSGFILYFHQEDGLNVNSLEKLLNWIEDESS